MNETLHEFLKFQSTIEEKNPLLIPYTEPENVQEKLPLKIN
jgi:hypothetical protein